MYRYPTMDNSEFETFDFSILFWSLDYFIYQEKNLQVRCDSVHQRSAGSNLTKNYANIIGKNGEGWNNHCHSNALLLHWRVFQNTLRFRNLSTHDIAYVHLTVWYWQQWSVFFLEFHLYTIICGFYSLFIIVAFAKIPSIK